MHHQNVLSPTSGSQGQTVGSHTKNLLNVTNLVITMTTCLIFNTKRTDMLPVVCYTKEN